MTTNSDTSDYERGAEQADAATRAVLLAIEQRVLREEAEYTCSRCGRGVSEAELATTELEQDVCSASACRAEAAEVVREAQEERRDQQRARGCLPGSGTY